MHGLGIPTTRALCLVGSDDKVYREQVETGATIVRMAPSHVRFGTFEIFYYRKQHEHLQRLADYVIEMHFPDLAQAADKYVRFLPPWSSAQRNSSRSGRRSVVPRRVEYRQHVDPRTDPGLWPHGFMDDYDPASSATIPTTMDAMRLINNPHWAVEPELPCAKTLYRSRPRKT